MLKKSAYSATEDTEQRGKRATHNNKLGEGKETIESHNLWAHAQDHGRNEGKTRVLSTMI